LDAVLAGRWQELYSFTLEPFDLVDFEPFNYWNSTSPKVRWTQQKVCTLPTTERRIVAVDMDFKIHGRGKTETIQAKTHEEYLKLVRDYFGLDIVGTFIE
jgi:N-hydroxyarylamine O-acetyltransferase